MAMWKAQIQVALKKSVLDPQGVAVEKALFALGYNNVEKVRVGKHLELLLQGETEEELKKQVEEMCRRLLTNPVIEEFTYTLQRLEEKR